MKDQQGGVTQRAEPVGQPVLLHVAAELVEQLGDGDEVDVGTLRHSLHAQRHGQVGFPTPRGTQEDDVLAVGDEAQCGELLDPLAIDRGLEGEVEVAQRLDEGEVGKPRLDEGEVGKPRLGQQTALRTAGGLGLEQPVEEVDVRASPWWLARRWGRAARRRA